jgi:hypothetical protein
MIRNISSSKPLVPIHFKASNISGKEIRIYFSKEQQDLLKAQYKITEEFISLYNSFDNSEALQGKFKFLNNVANIALRTGSKFKDITLFVKLVDKFVDEYKSVVKNPDNIDNLAIKILYLNTHIHNYQILKAMVNSLSLLVTWGSDNRSEDPEAYKQLLAGADTYDTFTKPYEKFLETVGISRLASSHDLIALKRLLTNPDIGDEAFFHILDLYMEVTNNPNYKELEKFEIDDYITLCKKMVFNQSINFGDSPVTESDLKKIIQLIKSLDKLPPYLIRNGMIPMFYVSLNRIASNLSASITANIQTHNFDNPESDDDISPPTSVRFSDEFIEEIFLNLHDIAVKVRDYRKDDDQVLISVAFLLTDKVITAPYHQLLLIDTLIASEFLFIKRLISVDDTKVNGKYKSKLRDGFLIEKYLSLLLSVLFDKDEGQIITEDEVFLRAWDLFVKAGLKEPKDKFIKGLKEHNKEYLLEQAGIQTLAISQLKE